MVSNDSPEDQNARCECAAVTVRHFEEQEGALIASFYQGVGSNHFFQDFVSRLADPLMLRSGTLAISNLVTREIRGGWSCNMEPYYLGIYVANDLASEDRLLHHVLQSPEGRFYSILADMQDADDYLNNGKLFEIWGRPQGIYDVAMALLLYEGDWIGFVAFHRNREQGAFQAEELACLNRLLPHMQRGLSLHRHLVDQTEHQNSVGRWLTLFRMPALLIDEKFEIVHHNEVADRYLSGQNGISLVDARLEFNDPEMNATVGFQVMLAIKHAVGQFELEPEVVRIEALPERPISLVFLPLKDTGNQMVTTASALLLIHDSQAGQSLDLSPIQGLWGLTEAELELSSALCQGLTLTDFAQLKNKSRETVRTQLRRVFSKVGVKTQTELVVSILTHPALLTLPSAK